MDPNKIRANSITKLISALQHDLSSFMNVELVGNLTDVERCRYLSKLNDGMPPELTGVEVMLMARRGETSSELALLIPEQLAPFFAGRPITWYASVIVEKRADGMHFTKNRYGFNNECVLSLDGEVVLSREPLVTATFTTPRTEKA